MLFIFFYFSGLKPNSTKSEIVGIGGLKGVQVGVCGMRCVNLNNDTLLPSHFSYNEKLKEEQKLYRTVANTRIYC